MRIEEIVLETRTFYIASDDTKFDSEQKCLLYEKFMGKNIYDMVKDYIIIYGEEENIIKDLKNNYVPPSITILVHKYIPQENIDYISLIEKGSNSIPNIPIYKGEPEPTLFYNDWTNSYSGSWGSNGWKKVGTLEEVERQIKYYTKMKEYFNKYYE